MIRVSTLLNDIFTDRGKLLVFIRDDLDEPRCKLYYTRDARLLFNAEGKIVETTFDLAKRVSRIQISIDQQKSLWNRRFSHDSSAIFPLHAKNRSLLYEKQAKF